MCDTFPPWSLQSTLEILFFSVPKKMQSAEFKNFQTLHFYKNYRRLKNQSRLDANPSQAQSSVNHTLSYTLT